jgi:putative PEP-CTERM system TPR-repeat lipoprotein
MGTQLRRVCLGAICAWVALAGCDRTTAQEHVARAEKFAAADDARSAIIEFKNALQKDPNLATARLGLGETELSIGDFPSAEKELERALDLGADKTRVMPPLLEAKLEFGRYQEVLGALEQLDSTPRLDVVRGRALLLSGDVEQATAAFRSALAADPTLATADVGLAQIALVANDPEKAAALLEDAVKADPRSRISLLAQGDLFATRGHYDDALASFNAAAKLPSVDLLAEMGVVRVFILQNKLDDADKAVDKVLVASPTYPMANYFKGLIAFQREDYAAAEKSLRIVQQQVPDHAPTLLLMGTVKFRQGQLAEADSLVGRFLTFDSANLSARRLLAAIRLSNNNPSGAIEALEPVEASLHDAQSLALLGTAYLRDGKGAKATTYLQQAVDLAPDVAALRNQLAMSMIAGGETKNAIAQLETAVSLDANLTQSDAMLVLLRIKEGNLEAASEAANSLVKRDPKSPIGYNLLGVVDLAKKDEGAATTAFEKSLSLDPGYSPAAQNLARIALAKGDVAGARTRLKTLLQHDAVDVAALSMLAQMASNERDWSTAKDLLERARSAHADALAPRVALARIALGTNDLELAQTVANEAVAIDGNSFDALVVRAQTTIALGNAGAAVSDVNKLHALLNGANRPSPRAAIMVASLQRDVGQLDLARANLARALQTEPNSNELLIALIQIDAQRGDAASAKTELDQLAKREIDATQMLMLRADVAAATGDLEGAAQSYRALAKGGNGAAAVKLANVLDRSGKLADATQTLQQFAAAHPDDFGAELALAGLVLKQGDRAGAINRYQALNARRGNNAVVLNNLAWLYFETKDSRALDTARRAYSLAPRNPEIADTLGWILVQQSGPDEAVKFLESAAGARPDDASIQYHLAVAYERLNRRTEARRAIDRSLELGTFAEREDAQALRTRL